MITANYKYEIEKTKDDYDILKILKDDKNIFVGSKYNMQKTIDDFLNKLYEQKEINKKIIFIFGFGMGLHIKKICSKYPKTRVIVFEPNEALSEYVSQIDWINDYKRLTVLCSEKEHLIKFLDDELSNFNIDKMSVNYFANYNKIYENEFSEIIKIIKDVLWKNQIDINTSMSYSKKWFDTLASNFKYIANGIPATVLRDKYKGKPAIIVSAGPSLEKNIDELKRVQDDFFIIVGGRTLRSVLDKGIMPSAIVNVDPSERNYNLVRGYIEETNIPLVFYEGTNEKIVCNHNGMKIFFTQKSFIKDIAEVEMNNYTFGGSVAHISTAFAYDMGCSPIIFIGQDLAYTNDQMYSNISTDLGNPNTLKAPKENGNNIWVEGMNNDKLRTDPVMYGFKQSMENYVELTKGNTLYINATEHGARINGTLEMPLKEVIEVYGGNKITPLDKIELDYKVDIKKNALNMLQDSKKSAKAIIDFCQDACKNVEILEKYYDNKNLKKVDNILLELNKLDNKIENEYSKLEMTESLIYPLVYDAMTSMYEVNFYENEIEEKKSDIISNNRRFYLNLSASLKYVLKKLQMIENELNGKTELEALINTLNL